MTDRENLKRLVSSGRAIALMPETFAMHDLYCDQGLIKLIPIEGSENFSKGIDYLLYPAKHLPSGKQLIWHSLQPSPVIHHAAVHINQCGAVLVSML